MQEICRCDSSPQLASGAACAATPAGASAAEGPLHGCAAVVQVLAQSVEGIVSDGRKSACDGVFETNVVAACALALAAAAMA